MTRSIVTNALLAVFVHILLLSVIWIGFPVPIPRSNVNFFYSGPSLSGLAAQQPEQTRQTDVQPITVKSPEAAFFAPWIEMRDLNKPKI